MHKGDVYSVEQWRKEKEVRVAANKRRRRMEQMANEHALEEQRERDKILRDRHRAKEAHARYMKCPRGSNKPGTVEDYLHHQDRAVLRYIGDGEGRQIAHAICAQHFSAAASQGLQLETAWRGTDNLQPLVASATPAAGAAPAAAPTVPLALPTLSHNRQTYWPASPAVRSHRSEDAYSEADSAQPGSRQSVESDSLDLEGRDMQQPMRQETDQAGVGIPTGSSGISAAAAGEEHCGPIARSSEQPTSPVQSLAVLQRPAFQYQAPHLDVPQDPKVLADARQTIRELRLQLREQEKSVLVAGPPMQRLQAPASPEGDSVGLSPALDRMGSCDVGPAVMEREREGYGPWPNDPINQQEPNVDDQEVPEVEEESHVVLEGGGDVQTEQSYHNGVLLGLQRELQHSQNEGARLRSIENNMKLFEIRRTDRVIVRSLTPRRSWASQSAKSARPPLRRFEEVRQESDRHSRSADDRIRVESAFAAETSARAAETSAASAPEVESDSSNGFQETFTVEDRPVKPVQRPGRPTVAMLRRGSEPLPALSPPASRTSPRHQSADEDRVNGSRLIFATSVSACCPVKPPPHTLPPQLCRPSPPARTPSFVHAPPNRNLSLQVDQPQQLHAGPNNLPMAENEEGKTAAPQPVANVEYALSTAHPQRPQELPAPPEPSLRPPRGDTSQAQELPRRSVTTRLREEDLARLPQASPYHGSWPLPRAIAGAPPPAGCGVVEDADALMNGMVVMQPPILTPGGGGGYLMAHMARATHGKHRGQGVRSDASPARGSGIEAGAAVRREGQSRGRARSDFGVGTEWSAGSPRSTQGTQRSRSTGVSKAPKCRTRPIKPGERAPWGKGFVSETDAGRKALLEKQVKYAQQVKAMNKSAYERVSGAGGLDREVDVTARLPSQRRAESMPLPTTQSRSARRGDRDSMDEENLLLKSIARLDRRLVDLMGTHKNGDVDDMRDTQRPPPILCPVKVIQRPLADLPRRPRARQGYTNSS